jgi:hypothetical protein
MIRPVPMKGIRGEWSAGSLPKYSSLAAALEGLQSVQADPIRSPAWTLGILAGC